MIDLQRLMVLRAVAAHGSVTAAAAALAYSPSAVSQQLARLERELGAELVRRQGRRITMTPLGLELASHAAVVLELAEELELRAGRRPQVRRRLRICAFPRAVPWLLAPALAECADALIDHEVEIDVVAPDLAIRSVRHGYAHFALVYSDEQREESLETRVLSTVTPRLIARADGRYPPPWLRACAGLAWVMPTPGTPVRAFIDRELQAAGIDPLIVATASTLDGVAALVEAGLGVSLLPPFGFASPSARLIARVPQDLLGKLYITAAVGRDTSMRPAIDRLLDAIERVLARSRGVCGDTSSGQQVASTDLGRDDESKRECFDKDAQCRLG